MGNGLDVFPLLLHLQNLEAVTICISKRHIDLDRILVVFRVLKTPIRIVQRGYGLVDYQELENP